MDYMGLNMNVHEIYAIGSIITQQQLMSFLGVIGVILIVTFIITSINRVRRSKEYRQFRADMFVAAKIDKLAKKEGLCLEKENKKFLNWCKKGRNQMLSLDDSIEADLKDKISEDISAEDLLK